MVMMLILMILIIITIIHGDLSSIRYWKIGYCSKWVKLLLLAIKFGNNMLFNLGVDKIVDHLKRFVLNVDAAVASFAAAVVQVKIHQKKRRKKELQK